MTKILYFCGHEEFQPEELVKHAVLAEDAGFDGVFVSEHFNPWVTDQSAAGFAFSTLGAMAVATKKILLMTGVVTPLFRYHPAVVAQAAATLSRLSGGRFMLGVGTGEPINEVPLGYTYPNYTERAARMREALQIMKKLLTGEKLTFTGEHYKTKSVKLHSPPLNEVQIFMAAGGRKSAGLAAEYADGLLISVKDLDKTKESIIKPAYEKAAHLKKSLPLMTSYWTVFAQNKEEAWQALLPWRGLRAPSRNTEGDPAELQKEADTLNKEEVLERYTIVSSAEDYIKAYTPLIKDLNSDYIVIQTTGLDNQEEIIKLLGEKVIPVLKNSI